MTLREQIRAHKASIREAEAELEQAADEMANAVIPYLRNVSVSTLARLKKKLRAFDAHRSRWKPQ